MPWYAASVVMYTKFKGGRQEQFPVWENILLIRAADPKQALKKASKLARERNPRDSSGSYTYENRPAVLVFAGIRKIIECDDSARRPSDGSEISYSQMLVKNKNDFKKLIAGAPVRLLYKE
mgnify:CR=1 FL=1